MERFTFTRDELIAAFAQWDRKVAAGGWDGEPNPVAAADMIISLLRELLPD